MVQISPTFLNLLFQSALVTDVTCFLFVFPELFTQTGER